MPKLHVLLGTLLLGASALPVAALAQDCRDAVVLVHGNTLDPSSWTATREALYRRGYADGEIFAPDWGLKACAACNDHHGSEEIPVREAISAAIAASCSGRIDVIAHSMGVTLAAQQIVVLDAAAQVDAFVGVAGALRGLWSCGVYPDAFPTTTCGEWGFSIKSPFLLDLYGSAIGDRRYSIKSPIDEIICATGTCRVGGVHSSRLWDERASFNFMLDHLALQTETAELQTQLIQ